MRGHALAIMFTALVAVSAHAQGQKPPAAPPLAQQPSPAPPADPAKPYKPVAVTPPPVVNDPALVALRAKIADAVKKKDRVALGKLIVSKGFFWERDTGDGADKKKSGIENLTAAIDLKNRDAPGWDMLASFADDPTAAPAPDHAGAMCGPADPGFAGKDMDALLQATQSDIAEWGYPVKDGVEVRDSADVKAPVTSKLGRYFVRVAPDANPAQASMLRIVTPAGQYGFVAIDEIAPLGNDQICYAKDGADWKIVGYVGAGSEAN